MEAIRKQDFVINPGSRRLGLRRAEAGRAPVPPVTTAESGPSSGRESELADLVDLVYEAEFDALVDEWFRATGHTSSPEKRFSHPSFLRILTMGRGIVVPLLLRSVATRPSPLVDALAFFTRDDPVPESDAGDMHAMSAAWVRWGEEHGYI